MPGVCPIHCSPLQVIMMGLLVVAISSYTADQKPLSSSKRMSTCEKKVVASEQWVYYHIMMCSPLTSSRSMTVAVAKAMELLD